MKVSVLLSAFCTVIAASFLFAATMSSDNQKKVLNILSAIFWFLAGVLIIYFLIFKDKNLEKLLKKEGSPWTWVKHFHLVRAYRLTRFQDRQVANICQEQYQTRIIWVLYVLKTVLLCILNYLGCRNTWHQSQNCSLIARNLDYGCWWSPCNVHHKTDVPIRLPSSASDYSLWLF